ncbi:MAG: endonuclease/exonuclease/phosphatase family protein [Alphaproteobacteria bacterium]|jgi:endonuclease/exonuclease/phosphatase family metal-dependent hydrolase
MKFVTYNIQYSKGKDGRYELERIADAVRGADVIALQEVVRHWPDSDIPDHPARLGELMSDFYWVYGPPTDVDCSAPGPDGAIINRRRQFGNMLLARWPIVTSRLLLLPRFRSFGHHNSQLGALEGVIDAPGGPLRVYSVHLNHLNGAERMAQIEFLREKLVAVPREGATWTGPLFGSGEAPPALSEDFVVMGDCNLPPGSPEYRCVVGEADYFYGPVLLGHHWADSWVLAGHDEADGITWYDEDDSFRSGYRLDYGFVSPGLATKVTAAHIDNDAPGSDHQPYWFELDV